MHVFREMTKINFKFNISINLSKKKLHIEICYLEYKNLDMNSVNLLRSFMVKFWFFHRSISIFNRNPLSVRNHFSLLLDFFV